MVIRRWLAVLGLRPTNIQTLWVLIIFDGSRPDAVMTSYINRYL
jgi:hypothetical protein